MKSREGGLMYGTPAAGAVSSGSAHGEVWVSGGCCVLYFPLGLELGVATAVVTNIP